MTQLVWVVVLIVLITVVQFAVYRYLGGGDGASGLEAHSTDGSPRAVPGDPAFGVESGGEADGRRCPACGSVNDPAFTFCRNCVSRIGA